MRGTPVHVQPSQFPRKRLSRELWSSVSSTNKYWGLEAQSSLSPLEWTKLTFHNEIRETHNFCSPKNRRLHLQKNLWLFYIRRCHSIYHYKCMQASTNLATLLSLLLLSESQIRARSQAQSVWGYFEVVMTVRTETTMRMGSWLRPKNPSNCRWNRKRIFGSKIYRNKFHAKFLNR